MKISVMDLRSLAATAKKNGTTEAMLEIALEWAEAADKEINRLSEEITAEAIRAAQRP